MVVSKVSQVIIGMALILSKWYNSYLRTKLVNIVRIACHCLISWYRLMMVPVLCGHHIFMGFRFLPNGCKNMCTLSFAEGWVMVLIRWWKWMWKWKNQGLTTHTAMLSTRRKRSCAPNNRHNETATLSRLDIGLCVCSTFPFWYLLTLKVLSL